MSNFGLFLLTFYAAGAFYAFIRHGENSRQLYGGVPFLIGACIGFMAYSASATAQYGAAATLYIIFFGFAVPLSVFGLGALMSSIVSFLPRTISSNFIKFVLVVAPVAYVAFEMQAIQERREIHEQQEAELLAEQQASFRMTNVKGTLSGFPITLPVNPQITLRHACTDAGPRQRHNCYTSFRVAYRLRVDDGSDASVPIRELIIETKNSAILAAAEWCDQRTDMENRVWCTETLEHGMRFYDTPLISSLDNWIELLDTPDDLRVFCLESWQGFMCQSHHHITTNVRVRGWFDDVTPEQVIQIAVDQQRLSNLIWQDITRQP